MVKITDKHGRLYSFSMFDAMVPGVGRAAVRRVSSQDSANSTKSNHQKTADVKGGRNEKKEKTVAKVSEITSADDSKAKATKKSKEEAREATAEEWTDELDKQLLELREKGVAWATISQGFEKSNKAVKNRYGELMKKKKNNKETSQMSAYEQLVAEMPGFFVEEGSKPSKAATGSAPSLATAVKAAKQQPKPESGSERHVGVIAPDEIYRAGDPGPIYDFKDNEKDVKLSLQEILFLGRMNDYFEDQKWLLLSSRFWDKTHKRVAPQALRRLFESEGAGKT